MPTSVQAVQTLKNPLKDSSSQKTENVSDPGQISNEDAVLLEKVLGRAHQKRSIQAAEYLSVKHTLPKTRIHRAILLENKSQARHLDMHLQSLSTRLGRFNTNYEISRRAFIDQQQRKQGKWKQLDELRATCMNFPILRADTARRPSMDVLYKSPRYPDQETVDKPPPGTPGSPQKPLLPYMRLRRERTELLRHKDQTFFTRLPTLIEIDQRKLKRYNTYCGSTNLEQGKPVKDERFENILLSLYPSKGTHSRLRKDIEKFVRNPNSPASPEELDSLAGSGKGDRSSKLESPTRRKKVTILCPTRTSTAAPSAKNGDGSVAMPRSAPNPKKSKILDDLKNKDLRELKKSYGPLRSSKERELVKSAASRASSEKSFSNTLQLEFTIESNVK